MPEPIRGDLPHLIPSQAAVEAVARRLHKLTPIAAEYDGLPPLHKFDLRSIALDMIADAAPHLVADSLTLVANNREQFGLDALDSMFDFETLAANVSTAAHASLGTSIL